MSMGRDGEGFRMVELCGGRHYKVVVLNVKADKVVTVLSRSLCSSAIS